MTRAKFTLAEKLETVSGWQIKWTPVTSGSKENEEFFKWTPYGELKIGTINSEVANKLSVGKNYYIDITEAV